MYWQVILHSLSLKNYTQTLISLRKILAFLAEIPSFIDELITMATVSKKVMKYDRKDYFKDYFLASDPYEEIINPIKLAVEKKKMSQ